MSGLSVQPIHGCGLEGFHQHQHHHRLGELEVLNAKQYCRTRWIDWLAFNLSSHLNFVHQSPASSALLPV